MASHGKNNNSRIVHKCSATRCNCVDGFFPETPLYVMVCAAFVFIMVSGIFTWHLKFLNPLVISLIQEDNKNLHPATTFLVRSQHDFGTCLYIPKWIPIPLTTEVSPGEVSEVMQVSGWCQCEGNKADREERPHSKTFHCLPWSNSSTSDSTQYRLSLDSFLIWRGK